MHFSHLLCDEGESPHTFEEKQLTTAVVLKKKAKATLKSKAGQGNENPKRSSHADEDEHEHDEDDDEEINGDDKTLSSSDDDDDDDDDDSTVGGARPRSVAANVMAPHTRFGCLKRRTWRCRHRRNPLTAIGIDSR
jgi:hypothetical protein